MGQADTQALLGETIERIEQAILPDIVHLLDTLIDASALARPGFDAAAYAAQLRDMANEVDDMTRQIEAMLPKNVVMLHQRSASRA